MFLFLAFFCYSTVFYRFQVVGTRFIREWSFSYRKIFYSNKILLNFSLCILISELFGLTLCFVLCLLFIEFYDCSSCPLRVCTIHSVLALSVCFGRIYSNTCDERHKSFKGAFFWGGVAFLPNIWGRKIEIELLGSLTTEENGWGGFAVSRVNNILSPVICLAESVPGFCNVIGYTSLHSTTPTRIWKFFTWIAPLWIFLEFSRHTLSCG